MEKTLGTHTEAADNKAEYANSIPANPAVLPENTATKPKKERHQFGKHKPLTAERIFDITAYGIWNYVIQVGTSVVAAKWFTEDGGKKYFDKTSKWLGENVVSKISKLKGIEAAEECRTPLIFVALITVGNLFIPPIQYAEKHKAKIVSWINDKVNAWNISQGNPPDAEELKEQKEIIRDIAAEPVQTSASLWGGRLFGLGANFLAAFIVGEKRNVAMKNAFADVVSGGLKTVGMKKLAESENARSLSKIAFLDYGYSIISSNVIYLYSHYINPPKYTNGIERHNGNHDHSSNMEGAPTPPPTPSAAITPRPHLLSGKEIIQLKPNNPELDHGQEHAITI